MRLREFALLEYRRDVTGAKLGAQLLAAANKDHFFAARANLDDTNQAIDVILQRLESMDPTSNQQYVTWLARQYIGGQFRMEDQPAVHQTLVDYIKLKPRLPTDQRDINRLDYRKVVSVVEDILNPVVGQPDTDHGTFPVVKNTVVLYNGPLGQLAQPQTETASCELGSGTKWCTAATKSENMYDDYSSNGDLYVWRDRNGGSISSSYPTPNLITSMNFQTAEIYPSMGINLMSSGLNTQFYGSGSIR